MKEDMVFIPAGEFVRGYNGGGFDEKPEGLVMLDAYWIDRHEVTYGTYIAFVTATGHRKPISRYVKHFEKLSGPTQPAVYVSWEGTSWSGWQTGTRRMRIETLRRIRRARRAVSSRSSGGPLGGRSARKRG